MIGNMRSSVSHLKSKLRFSVSNPQDSLTTHLQTEVEIAWWRSQSGTCKMAHVKLPVLRSWEEVNYENFRANGISKLRKNKILTIFLYFIFYASYAWFSLIFGVTLGIIVFLYYLKINMFILFHFLENSRTLEHFPLLTSLLCVISLCVLVLLILNLWKHLYICIILHS